MRKQLLASIPLLALLYGFDLPNTLAGDCDQCKQKKRHCCLRLTEAPRGEIAFAVPGVVREGTAIKLSKEATAATQEMALRELTRASTKKLKAEASTETDPSVEDRLDKLETDVKEMKSLLKRMSVVMEQLTPDPAQKR